MDKFNRIRHAAQYPLCTGRQASKALNGRRGQVSRGTSAILITIVASAVSVGAFAKRLPPKPVAPLVADGVRYEVPHFGAFHGKEQNGGFVQAWDARKNQLLWDRMIYRIRYDRNLERDVQDVFITEIHLDGKTFFVTNESSERFEMDLASGKVRALTPLGPGRELPVGSAKR